MKDITFLLLLVMLVSSCNSNSQMKVTKPSAMDIAMKPMNKPSTDVGINTFLENVNAYSFKCGCDPGKMKTAKLEEDGTMKMTYYYMCNGKKLRGFLEGKYDTMSKKFIGIYNTENKMFYGPIEISWNDNGKGSGIWDNGVGTVEMKKLK